MNSNLNSGKALSTLAALFTLGGLTVLFGDRDSLLSAIGLSFLLNLIILPIFIAHAVTLGRPSLYLVHLLAVWTILCMAPTSAYMNGRFINYDFFAANILDADIILANIAILVWTFVVYFVYKHSMKDEIPSEEVANMVSPLSVWIQVVAGILSLIYLAASFGIGLTTRAGFEESLQFDTALEIVVVYASVRMISIFAFAAGFMYLGHRYGSVSSRYIMAAVLPILGFGIILANNPIAAARFFSGSVGLGLAFLLFFRVQRRAFHFLVAILLALYLIFPLDIGRSSIGLLEDLKQSTYSIDLAFRSDNYRSYETLLAALRYIDTSGAVVGAQLIGNLLFFIPRSIWSDKAFGTGTFLAESGGELFTNVACPLQCEALVNFGLLGIPIFAGVFAFILKLIDKKYWNSIDARRDGFSIIELLYPFFLGLAFFLTRGDLLSPLAYGVMMALGALPIVVVTYAKRLFWRL